MASYQNKLRTELSAKAEQIKQQKQIAFWIDVCKMPQDLKDDYEKALQWAIEKQRHDDTERAAWQNKYREYLTAIEENYKTNLLAAGLTQEEIDSGYVSYYTGNDPQLFAKDEAKRLSIQEVEKQHRFENEALNIIFGVAEEITPPAANTGQGEGTGKRFRVALSFPGEYRAFVENVADNLADKLSKDQIFYDKWHEHETGRPNLDTYLQKIYHDDSELVVIFLCAEYEQKDWCGLEWRAVRDLIKKKQDSKIMFMRFDHAPISGIFSIDGSVDVGKRS